MRPLLYGIAAVLILGGFVAICDPKEVAVPHQAQWWVRSSTEVISKDRSVIYGFVSLGLGSLALVGAMTCRNWYVGTRIYVSKENMPNQSTDPTLASGTPDAGHQSRHP